MTHDLVGDAILRAPDSPDHAEDVLEFFCDGVDNLAAGIGAVDRRALEYIAACFRRILDGDDPKEALHLARRRGEPRLRATNRIDDRNFALAIAVARRMKHGMKREKAIDAVAGERVAGHVPVGRKTVENAYELYGELIRRLDLA